MQNHVECGDERQKDKPFRCLWCVMKDWKGQESSFREEDKTKSREASFQAQVSVRQEVMDA